MGGKDTPKNSNYELRFGSLVCRCQCAGAVDHSEVVIAEPTLQLPEAIDLRQHLVTHEATVTRGSQKPEPPRQERALGALNAPALSSPKAADRLLAPPHDARAFQNIASLGSTPLDRLDLDFNEGSTGGADGHGSLRCGAETTTQCSDTGSTGAAEDATAETVICRIAEGMRFGKLAEARQNFQRLTEQYPDLILGGLDTSNLVESLQRIGSCFNDSMEELLVDPNGGWTSESISDDMSFSYRFRDGTIQVVCSGIVGGHVLRALAGLLESDLCQGYKANVVSAAPLSPQDGADSVWHIRQRGKLSGTMEDNIVQVSCVDALDDALGSLWVCMYPPANADRITSLRGIPVPALEAGSAREPHWRTTFRITPSSGSKKPFPSSESRASGKETLHVSVSTCSKPSRAQFAALNRMPSFALKKMMSASSRELLTKFSQHCEKCKELENRIENSPRSSFYEHIRRRLAGGYTSSYPEQPKSTLNALLASAKRSDSKASSIHDDAVIPATASDRRERETATSDRLKVDADGMRPSNTELLDKEDLTWEELSIQIPIEWANSAE